ncbi:hypothetical protein D3C85_1013280 [compost metagenome]
MVELKSYKKTVPVFLIIFPFGPWSLEDFVEVLAIAIFFPFGDAFKYPIALPL